jgi:hypothetical protein
MTFTIADWDQLTDRQKVIRQSMYAYYFIQFGLKPNHWLNF